MAKCYPLQQAVKCVVAVLFLISTPLTELNWWHRAVTLALSPYFYSYSRFIVNKRKLAGKWRVLRMGERIGSVVEILPQWTWVVCESSSNLSTVNETHFCNTSFLNYFVLCIYNCLSPSSVFWLNVEFKKQEVLKKLSWKVNLKITFSKKFFFVSYSIILQSEKYITQVHCR